MRATETELAARASLLFLQMQPAPGQVCLTEGSDIPGRGDKVARILDILRSVSAPEAADAIHQQVARFINYRRSDRSVGEHIAECDPLQREAKSKMDPSITRKGARGKGYW